MFKKIHSALPIMGLVILNALFIGSVIAPDLYGVPSLLTTPFSNFVFYIPPILISIYLSYKSRNMPLSFAYYRRLLGSTIGVVFSTLIILYPVARVLDNVRCSNSHLCVGGEPYDNMTTTFLFLGVLAYTFVASVASGILGTLMVLIKKNSEI